jgi:ornithine decarboxylase
VLISTKSYDDNKRWVYLDIGKFGGLPETMGEAIQYRMKTPHDGGPKGPVVLAGPTCDEVDVLYDKAGYHLPLDLKVGDKVQIMAAGAYTTTYSSVGFNGFPPLASYYI